MCMCVYGCVHMPITELHSQSQHILLKHKWVVNNLRDLDHLLLLQQEDLGSISSTHMMAYYHP